MRGRPRSKSTAGARLLVPAIMLAVVAWSIPAAASTWSTNLAALNSAQAQARGAPAAPTSPTATCLGTLLAPKITVAWTAVPNASTYTVYQSTSSATGPFTQIVAGLTATSWTSGTLSTATYWFQVSATVGSNWISANSTSTTGRSVILGVLCG